MFDELTAGNVSPEEQQQANRIVRAKAGRISPEQFEQGMRTAKIFPFRLPGLRGRSENRICGIMMATMPF
jgi:hypothetical protein